MYVQMLVWRIGCTKRRSWWRRTHARESSFHQATAAKTSRSGTREHPDQDNGRSRECRNPAEDPKDRILRRRLRWGGWGGGGFGATRIVAHLLASKRKSGSATPNHLFRATNCEFAGQFEYSGKSLSARAAAARTRDSLVEEAEVAQTSDELEAVATKLAQLFPARRCCLICP